MAVASEQRLSPVRQMIPYGIVPVAGGADLVLLGEILDSDCDVAHLDNR